MFIRKPLSLVEPETDPEGGNDPKPPEGEEATTSEPTEADDDAEESQEDENSEDDGDGEDLDGPFDAARALKKIRQTNAKAKRDREARKAAEDKAKGLEPAKREAAEQRVARRLGLPDTEEVDEFLSRLKGETVDELAEDAERLLSLMAPKDEKKSTTTRPKERLRGGGKPDEEPEPDAAKLADSILSTGF